MRRACLRLDDANIPLLLTNHDSFLVRLEQAQFQNQLDAATQSLTDAAADVLDGFRLKSGSRNDAAIPRKIVLKEIFTMADKKCIRRVFRAVWS